MTFPWDGCLVRTTLSVHPVHHIKTGQCVPYDDISSGQYTIHVYMHISWCRPGPYNKLFLRGIYLPGFCIALAPFRPLTLLPFPGGGSISFIQATLYYKYVYYIISGIGKAGPYRGWCDCFEQCGLVLLNIVVSFSLLMSNWKICFLLITSGLVQMLHK